MGGDRGAYPTAPDGPRAAAGDQPADVVNAIFGYIGDRLPVAHAPSIDGRSVKTTGVNVVRVAELPERMTETMRDGTHGAAVCPNGVG
jgi:hypothetical protein